MIKPKNKDEIITWCRSEIKEYEKMIEKLGGEVNQFPYSVSEWKRIGIERGYWDYFQAQEADVMAWAKKQPKWKYYSFVAKIKVWWSIFWYRLWHNDK